MVNPKRSENDRKRFENDSKLFKNDPKRFENSPKQINKLYLAYTLVLAYIHGTPQNKSASSKLSSTSKHSIIWSFERSQKFEHSLVRLDRWTFTKVPIFAYSNVRTLEAFAKAKDVSRDRAKQYNRTFVSSTFRTSSSSSLLPSRLRRCRPS